MCQTNVDDGMRNEWKAAKEAIQRIGGGSERHAGSGLTFVSKYLVSILDTLYISIMLNA